MDMGVPDAGFGPFTDEDFVKPRRKGRWLKRSLIIALALGVVGGGLYGGYEWTQTQYYVGAKDNDHVAVYQGINQDLAWVSLSSLYQDHPEIELKYLPVDQRSRVVDTITVGSREQALQKAKELGTLASACKKEGERRKAEQQQQRESEKQNADRTGGAVKESAKDAAPQATPAPSPGPTLTEEEQKLVPQCSSAQQ